MFSVILCINYWFLATILNLIATRFWLKSNRTNGILSAILTAMSFVVFLLYLFLAFWKRNGNLFIGYFFF